MTDKFADKVVNRFEKVLPKDNLLVLLCVITFVFLISYGYYKVLVVLNNQYDVDCKQVNKTCEKHIEFRSKKNLYKNLFLIVLFILIFYLVFIKKIHKNIRIELYYK